MQISVSGQHISIGSSLQEYVQSRTTQVVKKYFANIISADIHFSKHTFQFLCSIIVNDGTSRHTILKSNSTSDDIYSSFDTAIAKIEKQLRKYKSKLNDRHEKIKVSEVKSSAIKYTIAPSQYEEDDEDDDAPNTLDNTVIIAEKPLDIQTLSVSEAVMRMDLENLPALMFININTNRTNIVYYRKDGNISWIDSK